MGAAMADGAGGAVAVDGGAAFDGRYDHAAPRQRQDPHALRVPPCPRPYVLWYQNNLLLSTRARAATVDLQTGQPQESVKPRSAARAPLHRLPRRGAGARRAEAGAHDDRLHQLGHRVAPAGAPRRRQPLHSVVLDDGGGAHRGRHPQLRRLRPVVHRPRHPLPTRLPHAAARPAAASRVSSRRSPGSSGTTSACSTCRTRG